MKKNTRILMIILIIAFSFFTIGFFTSVSISGGFRNRFDFKMSTSKKGEDYFNELSGSYQNISIDIISANTVIKPSGDNMTRVNFKNYSSPSNVEAKIKGDTLHITEKRRKLFQIITIDFSGFDDDSVLEIEIPKKRYNDILIELVSGEVITEGIGLGCNNLDLKIVSGDMVVDIDDGENDKYIVSGNAVVDLDKNDKYTLENISGNVILNNAYGTGEIELVSGDITVNYAKWNSSLNIDSVSGVIDINLPEGSGINLNSTIISNVINYNLGGRAGEVSSAKNAQFGGDNVQDVTIELVSGDITFSDLG